MNTEVHRVVKGLYVQCGDLSKLGIKDQQKSIHGGEFADESFHVKHTEPGLLGMCKRRGFAHSNESQFYITTSGPLTFLDNKYVVFGRVIMGMRVIRMLDKSECVGEKPVQQAKIVGAGIYQTEAPKASIIMKKKL